MSDDRHCLADIRVGVFMNTRDWLGCWDGSLWKIFIISIFKTFSTSSRQDLLVYLTLATVINDVLLLLFIYYQCNSCIFVWSPLHERETCNNFCMCKQVKLVSHVTSMLWKLTIRRHRIAIPGRKTWMLTSQPTRQHNIPIYWTNNDKTVAVLKNIFLKNSGNNRVQNTVSVPGRQGGSVRVTLPYLLRIALPLSRPSMIQPKVHTSAGPQVDYAGETSNADDVGNTWVVSSLSK